MQTDKRISDIAEKASLCRNVREFYKKHPYLYKWSRSHNVDIKQYIPTKRGRCKLVERENKGIDCYIVGKKKLYKHFDFVSEALRELDMTYYYVNRVLDGIIPSIDGYVFIRCN